MIVLLDCSPNEYPLRSQELCCETGQLLTPLTRHALADGVRFGIDNGAYSCFDAKGFRSLVSRMYANRERCLFVACPDVVGSARRTLEAFDYWYPYCEAYPVALVGQDGLEDLSIPWTLLKAIFVGGTTKWKLSKAAEDVIRTAKLMDKWVHVGRVNTPERYDRFESLGCDSCDGTGVSRYTHMRQEIGRVNELFKEACDG